MLNIDAVKLTSDSGWCLTFTDNGTGLSAEQLLDMLSFGYSSKHRGAVAVGQYGNGFKSASMRIGDDTLVFTKHVTTMSVGFLSQNFLRNTNADTVIVPVVNWNASTNALTEDPENKDSLSLITSHSIFNSEEDILTEFGLIRGYKGTRIIIWNLKEDKSGRLELDLESKADDILNPGSCEIDGVHRPEPKYVPAYRRSLREYCSILYTESHIRISVRGKYVKPTKITETLGEKDEILYKPRFLQTGAQPLTITYGFARPGKDFGLVLYYKKRLIRAYKKIGSQEGRGQTSDKDVGHGVVGVVDVGDVLKPIHNKQDFVKDDRYNTCMSAFALKLKKYWQDRRGGPGGDDEQYNDIWTWVKCDKCDKERRLPLGVTVDELPDEWDCSMNPDPAHNRCDVPQEKTNEASLTALDVYNKTPRKRQKRQSSTASNSAKKGRPEDANVSLIELGDRSGADGPRCVELAKPQTSECLPTPAHAGEHMGVGVSVVNAGILSRDAESVTPRIATQATSGSALAVPDGRPRNPRVDDNQTSAASLRIDTSQRRQLKSLLLHVRPTPEDRSDVSDGSDIPVDCSMKLDPLIEVSQPHEQQEQQHPDYAVPGESAHCTVSAPGRRQRRSEGDATVIKHGETGYRRNISMDQQTIPSRSFAPASSKLATSSETHAMPEPFVPAAHPSAVVKVRPTATVLPATCRPEVVRPPGLKLLLSQSKLPGSPRPAPSSTTASPECDGMRRLTHPAPHVPVMTPSGSLTQYCPQDHRNILGWSGSCPLTPEDTWLPPVKRELKSADDDVSRPADGWQQQQPQPQPPDMADIKKENDGTARSAKPMDFGVISKTDSGHAGMASAMENTEQMAAVKLHKLRLNVRILLGRLQPGLIFNDLEAVDGALSEIASSIVAADKNNNCC